MGVELDKMGRVMVEADLSVPGMPEVFVIGDLAHCRDATGKPLPGLAPVALQQGRAAGDNIERRLAGAETRPFRYRDKGTMATIGRGAAIAEVGSLRFSGFIAWLAWIFVHLFFLIGFRNRVAVLMEWAWAYITWQRGARLITGPLGPDLDPQSAPLGEAGDRDTPEREDALAATVEAGHPDGRSSRKVDGAS